MRKIIQISTTGVANNSNTQCNHVTTVLCDDGTVWQTDDTHRDWVWMPPIPQDESGYKSEALP